MAPTEETIADGTYGFSRSLYIYVSTNAMAENPAVGSFVDLYLSDDGLAMVGDAGYVDLPADRHGGHRGRLGRRQGLTFPLLGWGRAPARPHPSGGRAFHP